MENALSDSSQAPASEIERRVTNTLTDEDMKRRVDVYKAWISQEPGLLPETFRQAYKNWERTLCKYLYGAGDGEPPVPPLLSAQYLHWRTDLTFFKNAALYPALEFPYEHKGPVKYCQPYSLIYLQYWHKRTFTNKTHEQCWGNDGPTVDVLLEFLEQERLRLVEEVSTQIFAGLASWDQRASELKQVFDNEEPWIKNLGDTEVVKPMARNLAVELVESWESDISLVLLEIKIRDFISTGDRYLPVLDALDRFNIVQEVWLPVAEARAKATKQDADPQTNPRQVLNRLMVSLGIK